MAPGLSLQEQIRSLSEFSACDVSDALLKLQPPSTDKVARAGYLADIVPFALGSSKAPEEHGKVIGPASTLKLIPRDAQVPPIKEESTNAIPQGSHWVDMTELDTIVVIDQPEGHNCAAIGGMMAQKMVVQGVKACIVGGRVRDVAELKQSGLPVFALGKSTVATSAESRAYSRNETISVRGVAISAGDIVFCDPVDGVVVIPRDLLDKVLALMPQLVAADEKVKEAIKEGMTVAEAARKFRS